MGVVDASALVGARGGGQHGLGHGVGGLDDGGSGREGGEGEDEEGQKGQVEVEVSHLGGWVWFWIVGGVVSC